MCVYIYTCIYVYTYSIIFLCPDMQYQPGSGGSHSLMTVLSEHLDLLTPLAGSRLIGCGIGGWSSLIKGIYTTIYVYIYTYTYVCIYIYTYVYMIRILCISI